jgi:hypothetical protein
MDDAATTAARATAATVRNVFISESAPGNAL